MDIEEITQLMNSYLSRGTIPDKPNRKEYLLFEDLPESFRNGGVAPARKYYFEGAFPYEDKEGNKKILLRLRPSILLLPKTDTPLKIISKNGFEAEYIHPGIFMFADLVDWNKIRRD